MITVALREKLGLRPVPPRASEAPQASGLLNLDKSTYFDQLHAIQPSERRLCVRYYKNAETCIVSWGTYTPRKYRGSSRKVGEEERKANAKRATARAKANIRRDALSIAADRMVTLTYVTNQQERDVALAHLGRWNRIMKKFYPHWESITVLEYQVRGAVHFHVALAGYYNIDVLRNAWQKVIGEKAIVNLAFKPDGRGNACGKMSTYMSKYLGKELDEGREFGEHRYFRTQGIDRPREVYHVPLDASRKEEFVRACDIIHTLLSSEERGAPHLFLSNQVRFGGGYMCGDLSTREVRDG